MGLESQGTTQPFPLPLWLRLFMASVLGANMGMGVGFFKSTNSMSAFLNGELLEDAAIGTFVAAGIGIVSSMIACFRQEDQRQASLYGVEQHRPSLSIFSWLVRFYLSSQGIAVLAMSIWAEERPVVGELLGRGVGSFIGSLIGLCYPLWEKIYIQCVDPAVVTSPRHWHQESHRDMPFYARLYFGAWAGQMATYAFYSPDADNFDHYRKMFTIIAASISVSSPLLFLIARVCLSQCITARFPARKAGQKIAWYTESQMDLPWYIRIYSAVMACVTITEACTKRPVSDTSPVYFFLVVGASLLSPMMCALFSYCVRSKHDDVRQPLFPARQFHSLRIAEDMPWYLRVAVSALAAAILIDTINYAKQQKQSRDMAVVIMALMVTLAVLSPVMMPVTRRCSVANALALPWYVCLLCGLWSGALMGTAFGTLIPALGNQSHVIADNIGPDFLGMSNAVAAPVGAFMGAGLSMAWHFFC